ncbi:hypothetical protein HY488_00675 [Candidatus Woesearchaeota archaeon]|nr:hypothetical protein [Candidatus Woesearchaeota archaeon]
MAESMFRGIISFFAELGVYDIVLPFLLVFTIVFAILEKTKILGTDNIGGKEYTKKNLNSMVAFVTAFLVIASTRLVAIINETLAHVALLLILSICFLMLIGSFYKEGEPVALFGKWRAMFMIIMFVGIILIALNAVTLESGESVLEFTYNYLSSNWSSNFTASVIFLVIIIIFILYITYTPEKGGGGSASHGEHGH